MKIYIASSWKNQHGVELLTKVLRDKGHEVISWIENNYGEGFAYSQLSSFEEWVKTEDADRAFDFDTNGAMECNLCIYYGPAGKDACMEVGMAYGNGVPVVGLHAKGEDLGLMRKAMRCWFFRVEDLLKHIDETNY